MRSHAGLAPSSALAALGRDAAAELRQPALAPPVMLALAERFAPAFGDAEIELLDVLVLAQRLGFTVEHHAAVFEHIAVTRVFQRHAGVLLREQERHRLLGVEIADDREN